MNYIQLKPGIFKLYYVYLDVPEYYADSIFIKYNIKVKFLKEFYNEQNRYITIFCKIRKQDKMRFEEAMNSLEKKMIICGYSNYPEYCDYFIDTFFHWRTVQA